ncbi:MAG UNVERIFIED_CONTAM: hypothetical protein LVQ98_08665 [Rickettsiaceae bacterium]
MVKFWEALACNIDGVIELDVEAKVKFLMHLLSQAKTSPGLYDTRIPNLARILDFIEDHILQDLASFEDTLIATGFMSEEIMDGLMAIIKSATRTISASEEENEDSAENAQLLGAKLFQALKILDQLISKYTEISNEIMAYALKLLPKDSLDTNIKNAVVRLLVKSYSHISDQDQKLPESICEKLFLTLVKAKEPVFREVLKNALQKILENDLDDVILKFFLNHKNEDIIKNANIFSGYTITEHSSVESFEQALSLVEGVLDDHHNDVYLRQDALRTLIKIADKATEVSTLIQVLIILKSIDAHTEDSDGDMGVICMKKLLYISVMKY